MLTGNNRMLRAISVIVASIIVVATFAVLVSSQDITVEAKPSESITMDGLSPQGESTLAEVVAGSKE